MLWIHPQPAGRPRWKAMNFPGRSGKRKGQSRQPLGSFPACTSHKARKRGQGCLKNCLFFLLCPLFTSDGQPCLSGAAFVSNESRERTGFTRLTSSVRECIKDPPQNTSGKMPDSLSKHTTTLNDYGFFKRQLATTNHSWPNSYSAKVKTSTDSIPKSRRKTKLEA